MTQFSNALLVAGSLILFHAAYSLQHFRSLIQSLEEASTGVSVDILDASVMDGTALHHYRIPPMDVWIELGVAFFLLLIGELTRTTLLPAAVQKGRRQKSLVAAPFVTRDFDIYSSRGSRGFDTARP